MNKNNIFTLILGITMVFVLTASSISVSFGAFPGSPNFQLESGVELENITCRDHLVLVLRTSGSPACVSEKTSERMNWEIIPESTETSQQNEIETIEQTQINQIPQEIETKQDNKIKSTERLILTSGPIPTETSFGSMGSICQPIQPSSVDFPSQVIIGQEFQVTFEYSLIVPDGGDSDDYENWEKRYEADDCNIQNKYGIEYILPDYVQVVDNRNVFEEIWYMWNISPASMWQWGFVKLDFDNTIPQTETITMIVKEPRFGNEVDQIRIRAPFAIPAELTILIDDDTVTFSEPPYYDNPLAMLNSTYYEELRKEGYNAPVSFTNQTHNLENALNGIDKIPERYVGGPPRSENNIPPSIDAYAEYMKMDTRLDAEMRSSDIEKSSTLVYGQAWVDELKQKYPELWTQDDFDVPDFPRDVMELGSWLISKPNGFAEIYLEQKPLTTIQIENLGKYAPHMAEHTFKKSLPASQRLQVLSTDTNSLQDISHMSIKDQLYALFPSLQTHNDHRSIVDKFLTDYLSTQNFILPSFYSIFPLAFAQSFDESFVYGKIIVDDSIQ